MCKYEKRIVFICAALCILGYEYDINILNNISSGLLLGVGCNILFYHFYDLIRGNKMKKDFLIESAERISLIERSIKEMKEKGLVNEYTTLGDVCEYAVENIRISEKNEKS